MAEENAYPFAEWVDPALVGAESAPATYDVEKGHIGRFVDAIGETNPIYTDAEAARAAGYPNIPAPPTFATAFRVGADLRERMRIDWRRILHGEMKFTYLAPVCVGDAITVTMRIGDLYEKDGKSGKMQFIVQDYDYVNRTGEKVMTAQSVTVYRERREGK